MVTAKIIFFNWDSVYGKLIRFATGSKWTHVGIIASEDSENVICFEALNKGLTKTVYSQEHIKRLEEQGVVSIKTVSLRTTPEKLVRACEKYEGAPYDWLSIFNIGFHFLFGKYALTFGGPRMVICSEFVARVLYELSNGGINFEEEYNKRFDFVTPADIFKSKYILG
jgi:hypothetical protein